MVVAPSHSEVTQRIRIRGGNWGVRSLRLALAMNDLDADGKVSIEEIVAALVAYGLGHVDVPMVAAWLQHDLGLAPLVRYRPPSAGPSLAGGGSSLWTTTSQRVMVDHRGSRPGSASQAPLTPPTAMYHAKDEFCLFQLMDCVTLGVQVDVEAAATANGAPTGTMGTLPDCRRQCIGTCFQEVAKRFYYEGGNGSSVKGGKSAISQLLLPLEYLCRELDFKCHPDVILGLVNLKDAIWCFFCSWGLSLDSGRGNVSETLFEQYWSDWSPAFSSDDEFCCFLFNLFRVDTTKLKKDPPPLVASRQECDRIFTSIDTNANNALSLAELDLAVIRLWPTFNNKPAIMRAYKAADTSGNGWLDREEFFGFMHFLSIYGSLYHKFKQVDTDSSGSLSLPELVAAKDLLGLEHETPVTLRAIFNEIDTNRGGKVLFEEFCVYMAKREGLDKAITKTTNQFSSRHQKQQVPPTAIAGGGKTKAAAPNFVAMNAMGGSMGTVSGGARPGSSAAPRPGTTTNRTRRL